MRTTVRLPDQLYDDVKQLANEEGTTVTSIMEDALRAILADRRQAKPTRPFTLEPYRPKVPGTLPGIDLNNSAALLDIMDGLE